jgi:hypothetical protein
MRLRSLPFLAALTIFSMQASSQQASAQTDQSQSSQRTLVTRDGGTDEVLQSIEIPPIAKAPFSLMLETEWTRPLTDGGNWTIANRRKIARDSSGRIYQERWLLAPKGGKVSSRMSFIQIADPVKHTGMTCEVRSHKCMVGSYFPTSEMTYKPSPETSGQLRDGAGTYVHENLGENTVAGLPTVGMRDTTTLNPGIVGNDRPVSIVREFWYSQKLGINLLSSLRDGRFGTQSFKVTELTQGEPEPALFEMPTGYTLVEQKPAASSE